MRAPLSTGRAAPAAVASEPHQRAGSLDGEDVVPRTLAGERTHGARAVNVRGVR